MRKKSVAVLDIRSSEITAAVGERGVNNTFIIKSKYTCAYDGYAEGELIDENSFINAVKDAVRSTASSAGGIKIFLRWGARRIHKDSCRREGYEF